jgi:hypothetical protein
MTVNMWIATAAWVVLTLGVVCWAFHRVHLLLVLTAILVDLALVLYLQFTRGAVQQAIRFDRPALAQFHILVSALAVLLYVPTVLFALRMLKDRTRQGYRPTYVRTLWAAYAMRTVGFILTFSMVRT